MLAFFIGGPLAGQVLELDDDRHQFPAYEQSSLKNFVGRASSDTVAIPEPLRLLYKREDFASRTDGCLWSLFFLEGTDPVVSLLDYYLGANMDMRNSPAEAVAQVNYRVPGGIVWLTHKPRDGTTLVSRPDRVPDEIFRRYR